MQIEVVGRLVEQQQGGAVEFEQEDLEAGLLAARQCLELLLGLLRQLVAPQFTHGGGQVERVLGPQNVEQTLADELGMGVGLRKKARDDARSQPPRTLDVDRRVAS